MTVDLVKKERRKECACSKKEKNIFSNFGELFFFFSLSDCVGVGVDVRLWLVGLLRK